MTVDFDALAVGDRVLAYGKPWEVRRLSEAHGVLVTRRNASGKQVIRTEWLQPDEIDEIIR